MQTVAGRAQMGIWICDFADASLGPHHELQFSIFVARRSIRDIPSHPPSLLNVMLTRPEVQMLCHRLWNNTPGVVAYNREQLSLNAQLSASTITHDQEEMRFAIRAAASGESILTGALRKLQQPSWRASFALLGQLGLAQTLRINRQPWVEMAIVNPLGVKLAHNGVARHDQKCGQQCPLFCAGHRYAHPGRHTVSHACLSAILCPVYGRLQVRLFGSGLIQRLFK